MACGKWNLTNEEEEYFIPLFKYMVDEIECGRKAKFDLSNKNISPVQARYILRKLGYSIANVEVEENCFSQNVWFYFNKEEKQEDIIIFEESNLCLFSCGATFNLSLITRGEK